MAKITVSWKEDFAGGDIAVEESDALSASPRACAVTDAYAQWNLANAARGCPSYVSTELALLEAETRNSPLRKVRP